jgi:pimeloyl-ACP methyl ester carboxylesterase
LNPEHDGDKFWDFDFEDMGTKDVPAEIDYIIKLTGQDKIAYIGHSMGGT